MNLLLSAPLLTVAALLVGLGRGSSLHSCRNQHPSYCGEHVVNSICDDGSLQCVCKPGFTLISRKGETFCVEILDWAKCRFDEDCVNVRHSICHPGAGRCICPRHLTYLSDEQVCGASSERRGSAILQISADLTSSGVLTIPCGDFGAIQGAARECLCPPLQCSATDSRRSDLQTLGDVRSVLYNFCNAHFLQMTTQKYIMLSRICLGSNDSRATSGPIFLMETEAFQAEICFSANAVSRLSRDSTCHQMKVVSSSDKQRLLCSWIRDPTEIRTLTSRGEIVLRSKLPSSSFPSLVLPITCPADVEVLKTNAASDKSEKGSNPPVSPPPSPSSVNSLATFSKDTGSADSYGPARCPNSRTIRVVAICFGSLVVVFFAIVVGWFVRILLKNRKAKQFQQALDSQV